MGASGTFDITSQPFALHRLLATIQDLCCPSCEFVPVTDQTLIAAKIGPWMNLPLWLPDTPDHQDLFGINTDRAQPAGLCSRPLVKTLGPLLDWDRTRRDVPLATLLTAAQEARLLQNT